METTEYFRQEDINAIAKAATFTELFKVAERVLSQMPQEVLGICDPISQHKGVLIKEGIETLFARTTRVLIEDGYVVFDERPFFKKFFELKEQWFSENPNKTTCPLIVDEFFMPLLATRKIKALLLLPNWQDMYVPYWEGTHAKDYGIETHVLPFDWSTTMNLGPLKKVLESMKETETKGTQMKVA